MATGLSTSQLRRLTRIAAGEPLEVETAATLTAKTRNALPKSSFAIPETREYPIHDLAHGRNALARASQHETGSRLSRIRAAVYRKYPELKKSAEGQ